MHNDWKDYWKDPKEGDALKKRIRIYKYNPQWNIPINNDIDHERNVSKCTDEAELVCDIPKLSVTLPASTTTFLYVLDKYSNYKSLTDK